MGGVTRRIHALKREPLRPSCHGGHSDDAALDGDAEAASVNFGICASSCATYGALDYPVVGRGFPVIAYERTYGAAFVSH